MSSSGFRTFLFLARFKADPNQCKMTPNTTSQIRSFIMALKKRSNRISKQPQQLIRISTWKQSIDVIGPLCHTQKKLTLTLSKAEKGSIKSTYSDKIHLKFTQNSPQVYPKFTPSLPHIHLKHTSNSLRKFTQKFTLKIHLKIHFKNSLLINPKFTPSSPHIPLKFTINSPQIHLKFTFKNHLKIHLNISL